MSLEIKPEVQVSLTAGSLRFDPSYSLTGLIVQASPHHDHETHERLLRETFGSTDWLWESSDEFRFSTTDRTLCGLTLHTPEHIPTDPKQVASWLDVPVTNGRLASETTRDFSVSPAKVKWVNDDGTFLICAYAEQVADQQATRLRVAQDLDLIFAQNRLVGWILESPILHVSGGPAQVEEETSRQLSLEYREYSLAMSEPNISAIQDGDQLATQNFVTLLERMKSLPRDPRRDAMIASLTQFHSDWIAD